jgi:hypothetical protein
MFRSLGGSYATGMESNASADTVLTLDPRPMATGTFARTCGKFTLRCLKAMARGFVESSVYYPYWIGAGPVSGARTRQESSR